MGKRSPTSGGAARQAGGFDARQRLRYPAARTRSAKPPYDRMTCDPSDSYDSAGRRGFDAGQVARQGGGFDAARQGGGFAVGIPTSLFLSF